MRHTSLALALLLSSPITARSDESSQLKPLMNVPDAVVFTSEFSDDGPLDKKRWQAKQGTQWKVAGGVLRGEQSTPEYQAKKADHKGYDPRIKSKTTPRQFIAQFSMRFVGGTETNLLPIVEFGHHNVRLKFSETGIKMLADHESVQLAQTTDVQLEPDRWYHLLAERNGDEFVVQFKDGPTLYAKHQSLAMPVADDEDGMSIAGTRKGITEIDNVTLWSIGPQKNGSWQSTRAGLPTTKAITIVKKQKGKKK